MRPMPKICDHCKHFYTGYENPDWKWENKCPAFPKKIPNDILRWKNFHHEKHPEQEGDYVFEEYDREEVRKMGRQRIQAIREKEKEEEYKKKWGY